ncbi:MAG: hypothetical protein HPY82_00455 [Gammaproteobacteria bacterium]|nr:hypothetical protein [Gammaproteobacteria bacterium]
MPDIYEWTAWLIMSIDSTNTDLVVLQVVGYTIADILIVFFSLRIATLFRQKRALDLLICYMLLGVTIVIAPAFLLVDEDPYQLMLLSLGTAGIHYAIIIYALFSIHKPLFRLMTRFTVTG